MSRIFNFSAGPAILPEEALLEAQANLFDYKGAGMSIMEMSHRGKEYDAVHQEALANLRTLLKLPESHAILLLQGGATMQFGMIPMNLLGPGQTADYINAGAWGKKAIAEARCVGNVNVAAKTIGETPARMPTNAELNRTPGAAYFHCTSNETIEGTQIREWPETDAPLICDMSSDILSRSIPIEKFAMLYAGAQKNLGPSGLAIVAMDKELARRAPETLPSMLRYTPHIENDSLYNTPPCFGIYMLALTTRWLLKQGGVEAIQTINDRKATKLYAAIDGSGGYYRGTAAREYRSPMNVTFRLPSEELEATFIKDASKAGMSGLKGHRSVGGIRASIYNAFPEAGVDALVAFMKAFQTSHG